MIQEIQYYSRMAWGIRQFLRTPPIADPEAYIRGLIAARCANFLDLAGKTIFNSPSNPYHEMFRIAGCTMGDLLNEVARNGLEPSLRRLREAGVYLSHDEFKLKTPIVRSGIEIPSHAGIFLNPVAMNALTRSPSSGSRS